MKTKTSTAILERIAKMRSTGYTFDVIGLELGMSRERVRQLHKKPKTINVSLPEPRPWLTTGEVSHLANIHVSTVRRWADQGILKSYRIGPRGDRRFRRKDVALLFKETISAKV
jgi:excisionase family DNA binding protein